MKMKFLGPLVVAAVLVLAGSSATPASADNPAPTEAENDHPPEAHQLTLNPFTTRCGWRGGPSYSRLAHTTPRFVA